MIDYGKIRLSLERVQQQNENYRRGSPDLSDLDRKGIAESVIQRFETCDDGLWKVLKRHLTETLGVAEDAQQPEARVPGGPRERPARHPRWNSGCGTPMRVSTRRTTTTARRRRPGWR